MLYIHVHSCNLYITIKMYRLSLISLNLQKVWLLVWRVHKLVGSKHTTPKAKQGSHWQTRIHNKGTQPTYYSGSTWTQIIFLVTHRKNTNSFNTPIKLKKTHSFTRRTTASRSLRMQNNVVCTQAYWAESAVHGFKYTPRLLAQNVRHNI